MVHQPRGADITCNSPLRVFCRNLTTTSSDEEPQSFILFCKFPPASYLFTFLSQVFRMVSPSQRGMVYTILPKKLLT